MGAWIWRGVIVGCLAGLVALSVPQTGPVIALAGACAIVELAAVVAGPRSVSRAPAATTMAGLAALVSVGATVTLMAYPPPPLHNTAAAWSLAELAALLALLATVLRRGVFPRAVYVSLLAGLAVTALPLRVTAGADPSASLAELSALGMLGFLPALGAAAAGGYLRVLDDRRLGAIAETRKAQRMRLAYDLHDFIGHDLNAIVLEAQAARLVPGRAEEALARIEEAGQAALSSMDQTLRMLDDGGGFGAHGRRLAELNAVVERFGRLGSAQPTLRIDTSTVDPVPREVSALAYRVVVESLTNVRRHAPNAATVSVEVTVVPGPALRVTVTDDGGHAAKPLARHRRGLGLVGLTEHVELLGGALVAGARRPTGWRVVATIPLAGAEASP